jgi:F0F1-type ATP synthase assembly protein I
VVGDRQSDPSGNAGGPRWTRRGLTKRGAKAYQGVLEAVLCMPAGVVLGYGADRIFGTDPWLVLVGLVLGFAGFVIRVVQLPRRLAAIPDEMDSDPS